jgi:hypothetical protein
VGGILKTENENARGLTQSDGLNIALAEAYRVAENLTEPMHLQKTELNPVAYRREGFGGVQPPPPEIPKL